MPTVAELSVNIDANDDATATIERLDALLKKLGTGKTVADVDVNTAAGEQAVSDLQLALFELDTNPTTADVDAGTAAAEANLATLQAQLAAIQDRVNEKVNLDIDSGAALSELAAIRAAIQAMIDNKETVNINIDIDGLLSKIAEVEAALKAIPDEKVTIEVDTDRGNAALARFITTASRASTQVNALAMTIALLGPALVPLGAVALAGIGALGAGFVAAAGGAALFAGVAMTNFSGISDVIKKMNAAQLAYNQAVTDKQRQAALEKEKALFDSLSPSQQSVVRGWQSMTNAWNAFAAQFQPQMFMLAGTGMQFIAQQIPRLTTLMNGMMVSAQTLETRLIAAFNGTFWQTFMSTMSQIAGPVMTAMVTAFGNIIKGIAGILLAFSPFAVSVAQGFQDMTAKFANWGANLANNPGFKSFINYVQANMPLVLSSLASLWDAMIAIVKAAAPWGTVVLAGVKAVLDLITALGNTNPNLLTFVIAMTGLGLTIVNLAGPLLNVAKLFSMIAGVVPEIAAALGLTVGALLGWVAVIAAVVVGIIYAYNHFETFRNAVNNVGSAIMRFAQSQLPMLRAAFDAVVAGLQTAWQWLQATFGPAVAAVVAFVVAEFDKMKAWAQQFAPTFIAAWNNIVSGVKGVLTVLAGMVMVTLTAIAAIWNAIWPGLKTVVQGVWTVISSIISGALSVIRGIITVFAGILAGDWSAVWSGLGMIVQGVWTAIWGIIRGAFQIIVGYFQEFMGLVTPVWNAIWNGISSVVSAVWNGIVAFVTAGFNAVVAQIQAIGGVLMTVWNAIWMVLGPPVMAAVQIVTAIVNAFTSFLSTVFNAVVSVVTGLWNGLWSMFGPVVQAAWTVVSTVVSAGVALVVGQITTAWNLVSSVTSTVWNAVSSFISSVMSAIVGFITSNTAAAVNLISAGWNSIVSFTTSAWNSAKTLVQAGIAAIVGFISTGITSALNFWKNGWANFGTTVSSAITTISGLVNNLITQVVSIITGAASRFFSAGASLMSNLASGITSGISSAVSAVSSAVSQLTSLLPGSPAKTGPLSGQGWTYVRGKHFSQDLAKGIDAGANMLPLALGSLTSAMSGAVPTTAAMATSTSTSSATVTIAPGAVVVQVGAGANGDMVRNAITGVPRDLASEIVAAVRRR